MQQFSVFQRTRISYGTPPLRGELTVFCKGGSKIFQEGSTPPRWGGWINPWIRLHLLLKPHYDSRAVNLSSKIVYYFLMLPMLIKSYITRNNILGLLADTTQLGKLFQWSTFYNSIGKIKFAHIIFRPTAKFPKTQFITSSYMCIMH